jgi:hypothetical protein
MMTSKHYLISLKQKETREEATIKDRKCKRQKQLANKEKNVLKKKIERKTNNDDFWTKRKREGSMKLGQ